MTPPQGRPRDKNDIFKTVDGDDEPDDRRIIANCLNDDLFEKYEKGSLNDRYRTLLEKFDEIWEQ